MKKLSLLIVLFVLGVSALLAQTKVITGTVTSAVEGEGPIPGVTVQVKGTTIGTATDVNGKYSVSVPANATTLIFSYIGMKKQEVEINNRAVIDGVMQADILGLGEVVVTALGISREKKALGYSVSDVKSDEIAYSKNTNVMNSLEGKVAGVRINNSTGAVGASTFIEIRGSSSLTRNNQPLFIIDGVPLISGFVGGDDGVDGVAHKDANVDLNPDDIESISVLKGGAATALYGLRASTGAVVITTKKGKAGATVVNFGSSVTIEQITQVPDLQNTYSQGAGGKWSKFNRTTWGARIDTLRYTQNAAALPADAAHYASMADYIAKWDPNGYIVNQHSTYANANAPVKTYNPYDYFQTGVTYNNNFSVSGGNENSTFFLSLANTSSTGVIPKNTLNKTNLKVSADHKFSKAVSMGANFNYVYNEGNKIQQGSNTSGVMLGLLRTPPTFDNSYGYIFSDGSQRDYRGGVGYDNPYWTSNKNSYKDKTNRVFGDIHASYTPLSWLSFNYRLGIDLFNTYYKDYIAQFSNTNSSGNLIVANSLNRDLNSDLLMNLHKTFGDIDAGLTLGQNIYASYYEQTKSQANGLIDLDFPNMNNTTDNRGYETTNQKRTSAFFGALSLNYKSMVFLDGTLRNEQTTTLPKGKNSFYYPSASFGFIFTELGGLKNNKILPYGKLRVSYAVTAQDAALYSTDNYYYPGLFVDGWTSPYGLYYPYNEVQAFSYTDQNGNLNLKPEKMKTFEVGAEFKMIDNRVNLDIAYFVNHNEDLLMAVPIASSTGYTTQYMNAGKMNTKGIELTLGGDIVRGKAFIWNLSVNWSNPKTMVDALAPGVDNLFLGGFTGSEIRAVAGKAYRSVYATVWARDDQGNVLISPTGTFKGYPVALNAMKYIADVQENWRMGIINTLSFKGIRLSAVLEIKNGGHMWNGTRGALDYFGTSQGTANRAPTDVTTFAGVYGYVDPITGLAVHTTATGVDLASTAAPVANTNVVMENSEAWRLGIGSGFQGPSEYYVEETGWTRLREVTLSYDLPKSVLQSIHMKGLGVYFTGRNLWLDTKYSGVDPETSLVGASNAQGMDYFNMPGTKSYTFGLKVSF
jgi:TonB-linked SusC/RagA family outer membrane protein